MKVSNELLLTSKEWEALHHRLGVSDCIAQALTDIHPDDIVPGDAVWPPDDVEQIADFLADDDLSRALDHSVAITHAVLIDAVHGSTWLGCIESEFGRRSRQGANAYRVLESLARKVGQYVGKEIECPTG